MKTSRHGLGLMMMAAAWLLAAHPAGAQVSVVDIRTIDVAVERIDLPVLSPSGDIVVFSGGAPDGRNHLYSVSVDGGKPTQITSGAGNDWSPRVSPDGNLVVFVSDRSGHRDLYTVPLRGGEPRRVTSDPAEDLDPDWSPDGTRLVFASTRGGPMLLYLVTLQDLQVYALSAGAGPDRRPAWSPDGRLIAFQSSRERRSRVLVMPAEGGEARIVSRQQDNEEYWPAWMPDSRTLMVQGGATGVPGRVWLLPLDEDRASVPVSIPPPPDGGAGTAAFPPSLSRNGQRIVTVGGGQAAIEVMPVKGGVPTKVLTTEGRLRHPSWSPEGRRLVVSADMGGAWDLWLVGVSSGRVSRLTEDDRIEETPVWSKATGDIVYSVSDRDGLAIHMMEPESKRSVRFSRPAPPPRDIDPAWSPDGKWMAYSSDVSGSPDLYIAPVGGGEARRLTESPGAETHPTWSPDGRWLAFASDQGGDRRIWKVPFEGGAPTQVSRPREGFGGDSHPSWSPTGHYIAFSRGLLAAEGGADLYIIPPEGGNPFPLRRGGGAMGARILEPAWSPDGLYIAYSFSRPDRIHILELGDAPIVLPPLKGVRGTPEGLQQFLEQQRRAREAAKEEQRPAEPEPEPAAPETGDPNGRLSGRGAGALPDPIAQHLQPLVAGA